jgi:hypothetical protein
MKERIHRPLTRAFSNTDVKSELYAGHVTLGVILFAARISVSINAFCPLYADDGLLFFAWLVPSINTVLWPAGKDSLYENIAVSSGQSYTPPADFLSRAETCLPTSVVIFFFRTSLWAIKVSFLVYFQRLGQNEKIQKTCGGRLWPSLLRGSLLL